MMEIEPEQTRQRNDSAFVEVSTVDILSGPVYVPVSSGDEYDEGSEDGADVAMEEDQSVPIGETSEDEDFMPNGDVAVERPKRMREKNYNTRSAGGPADESLTTDEESSSRHSRPRRKKTRFQIVESGDSEIEDLEESRDLESNSTDQPPVQNVSRFAVSPWLYQNTPKPFPYLPQLQDLVIYCRQGHEEFAKLTSEYPMIVDESLPDILLARVIKINYFLANAIEVCSIKLGIFPTLQPADIPDSKLSPLTIELIHKPECEDFLSLWNDFQHSANSHIEIGDTCSAMVLDKEIQGNLIEIKSGPSPWKKYTIQDGTGSKYEVCPWKMCDSGNSFASHLSVQEDQLERMLSVIQDFRSHEHLDPFVDEIDFDSFPNYLDLVAYPICVQLIHTRLQTGFYRSVAQVGFEWDLMCKNVNTFNKRGSLICQLCKNEVAPYKFKLLGKLNLNQGTNPKPKIQPILDQLDDFVEDEDEEDEDKFSAFTDEESDEFADKARDSRLRSRPKKKSTSRKSTRLGAASRKSIKSLDDEFEFMSDSEDQLISAPSRSSRRRNEMKDTQAHNQSKSNSRSKSNTSSANRENGRTKEKVVSSDESHYGEIIENLRAVSRARIEAASSGRKRRIIRMGISNDSDTEESTTQSSPLPSSSSEYYSE